MNKWFAKIQLPRWVLALVFIVLILRVPSLLEPYYYGDEMIYLSLGQGVRQGATLYKDVHDNKPPLLYLTAALAGNLFWFKAILMVWSIATIIAFYYLTKKIFLQNEKAQMASTFIFSVLTTIPLLEGNIVNAELFMIGFSILAILILLQKELSPKKIYFAGVLFGLGTLFKVPAAFDLPVIIAFWLVTGGVAKWQSILKHSVILSAGFATPLLASFAWYFAQGVFPEYFKAAFLQNVGYLSSFRPGDVVKPFYVKNAPLLIRAFVVLIASGVLYGLRHKLSRKFILSSIWLVFSLFAVTLSERPYPHYFIQAVAPVSILLGIFFAEKSIEQSLTVIPLTLALFVPYYYKFYHYPTLPYYSRFINLATGRIDKGTYLQSFSTTVLRNYEISRFIMTSSHPDEKVFMWDPDSSAVYALSRRLPPIKYVADYHINDFSSKQEVAKQLEDKMPKFIILTSGHTFEEIRPLIKEKYLLITQIQNANIYSRIDFAPRP